MSKTAKIIAIVAAILIVWLIAYFIYTRKKSLRAVNNTGGSAPAHIAGAGGTKKVSDLSNGLDPDVNSRPYTGMGSGYTPAPQNTGGNVATQVTQGYTGTRTETQFTPQPVYVAPVSGGSVSPVVSPVINPANTSLNPPSPTGSR